MQVVDNIFFFIICYLIGSIPSGLIIGKTFKHIDIREHGSGNLGGTNAIRVLGKPLGIIVGAMDVLKGGLSILLAQDVFHEAFHTPVPVILFGIAAVVGHIYPVFAKFRGGKAVATSGGVLLFYSWPICLFGAVVFIITMLITRYVSLASTMVAYSLLIVSSIVNIFFKNQFLTVFHSDINIYFILTVLFMTAFITVRHIPNYKRLLSGTEHKIGEKKA